MDKHRITITYRRPDGTEAEVSRALVLYGPMNDPLLAGLIDVVKQEMREQLLPEMAS